MIRKKYCGTAAKAGGNGENKHHPTVKGASCLLTKKNAETSLLRGIDSLAGQLPGHSPSAEVVLRIKKSIYKKDLVVSDDFLPQERGSGAIILNTQLLDELGIDEPTSYEDLLKPEFRGLVSVPNPKDSSTGYIFYKSLVNAWGEKETLDYFDKLTENILQYTESGSGPLNAVAEGKAAVGLGTTATAAAKINEGAPIKITYFKEGAPYAVYGQAIIKGKEKRKAVRDVFDFLVNTFNYENCKLYMPETLYKDKTFTLKNYPTNIKYADMSNNTVEEKERLLAAWDH